MMAEPKVQRSEEQREAHRAQFGFKGRKYMTNTLPLFRPYTTETPPSNVAVNVAVLAWFATGTWFAVSMVGYLAAFKMAQLPKGETMNIELIFSTLPLNRWALTVVMSLFVNFFMFLQMLFLVFYRLDRSIRRSLAGNLRRDVLSPFVRGNVDHWDEGAELMHRQNEAEESGGASHGYGQYGSHPEPRHHAQSDFGSSATTFAMPGPAYAGSGSGAGRKKKGSSSGKSSGKKRSKNNY